MSGKQHAFICCGQIILTTTLDVFWKHCEVSPPYLYSVYSSTAINCLRMYRRNSRVTPIASKAETVIAVFRYRSKIPSAS